MKQWYLLFLLPWLCAGCEHSDWPKQVSYDQYMDRKLCWNERDEYIEGFLIIRRNSAGEYFPQTLSAYCFTEGDVSLVDGPVFPVIGDNGNLMRLGLLDKPLSSNIISDQMPASNLESILAFRARLRPVQNPGNISETYVLENFNYAVETDLTAQDLVDLGPAGRWNLFRRAKLQ